MACLTRNKYNVQRLPSVFLRINMQMILVAKQTSNEKHGEATGLAETRFAWVLLSSEKYCAIFSQNCGFPNLNKSFPRLT